ncbi:VWA domain-containing protein [Beggiatoa leptomitoformis]|uniref:Tellurium resistance protein n=1 Tax=Beggiatoa leptomitoformis TaxID=288004 RepID=A0A2N9YEB7_9GAMM|nr:VWA domain-containing protein [Beggiatoa leptomitoformis]ALG68799.1 tellurium resistance protein [Beggiatoa leptomitoformis]AUI68838.1 tellurium resistance protein [Beggiatoa leptomitoformis]
MQLQRGQKIKLVDLTSLLQITVGLVANIPSGMTIDISCFGIDAQDKLSDDRYFIFYNQKNSPCGSLTSLGSQAGDNEQFQIDLAKLPATIRKLVFTMTIDGQGSMSQLQQSYLRLLENEREIARFSFTGADFDAEKAIMVGELYFKDVWRFAAVGQGFNGGLSALLKHFGGEEATSEENVEAVIQPPPADIIGKLGENISKGFSALVGRMTEKTATPKPTVETSVTTTAVPKKAKLVSLEKQIEKEAPHLVNLAKTLMVSLEKKNLQDIVASVVLVLDASGSMSRQYEKGDVQLVVDKVVPLALHFDDDGKLETWAFAKKQKQLSAVTLKNVKDYVKREWGGWSSWMYHLNAYSNNEPVVMRDIISTFRVSKLPVYVIFISDGGVGYDDQIEKLLVESSHYPIFWQFVGLGGSNYGILERFDKMRGRKVDNCNFFALDDIKRISDKELYDRLLNEFPQWLIEAKKVGVLR